MGPADIGWSTSSTHGLSFALPCLNCGPADSCEAQNCSSLANSASTPVIAPSPTTTGVHGERSSRVPRGLPPSDGRLPGRVTVRRSVGYRIQRADQPAAFAFVHGRAHLAADRPSYLSRLRAGSGVVAQRLSSTFAARSTLDASATSQLPQLYAALETRRGSRELALALRRLLTASERASHEDRLVDSWIAFEALFVRDASTELSFRASLRIARYIGSNRAEREELRVGLKNAYE